MANPQAHKVVSVQTTSATSQNVSTDSNVQAGVRTNFSPTALPITAAFASLRGLDLMLAGASMQCQANAAWHAVAGAAFCGVGIMISVATRLLAGQWLLGGLDIAILMSPAGMFFQTAKKRHDNAQHFQALKVAVQAALATEPVDGAKVPPNDPDEPISTMVTTAFHASHATLEQRVLRARVLDLLTQIPGAEDWSKPPLKMPARLEFLGQMEPKRFLVRADGRDCLLPRILYRMLLGMAVRRQLFENALPRGNDPGSFFRIGDRRDRVHDLEVAFREIGMQILDEDGRGTKMRRVHCPPEGISIDPTVHLSDPDIVEDDEVRVLLEALAARAPSNGHPT